MTSQMTCHARLHPWFRGPSPVRLLLAVLGMMAALFTGPSAVRAAEPPPAYDPSNTPPAGFTALFNGKDLANWQGLIDGPPALAKLTPEQRAEAQAKADESMRAHWHPDHGVLVFDGKGQSLQTKANYQDFELYVDWKIEAGGDSGIYLRGSPQVQIWDNPIGSGGLYNNQKNPANPLVVADAPIGQWNRFHIIMKGERVTVYLNDKLVVDNTILENYWERDKPIYPSGPIELQNHGNSLYFKNIFVRDLTTPAKSAAQIEREARMVWWREARFGMFIHWGLYAIPAGVWDGQPVPGIGEWIMDRAKIPPDVYEKLASQFDPMWFNAQEWAHIAKDAGMKYVVITTKHHDGFCLFDSKETTYDVMDATPFKRDIMKELSEAVRAEGLKMCWYHSIMDWHHPDAKGDAFPKYEEVLRNQVSELLTNYGPVGVMWFDGEWIDEWTPERGQRLYDLCRKLQPNVIVNNRVGKGRQGMAGMTDAKDSNPGDFGTPEQEVPDTGLPGVDWESCMTMNDTWGFKTADVNWKSYEDLIETLVDIASKGGNFLLNVGPTADGNFPRASIERLYQIGRWLDVNGEAIYGTGPSPFADLAWGHCTTRPNTLYLFVRDVSYGHTIIVPGLLNEVISAKRIAGTDPPSMDTTTFQRCPEGLNIVLPPGMGGGTPSAVIKLSIVGDPAVVLPPEVGTQPDPEGTVLLKASDAAIHSANPTPTAKYEPDLTRDCIGFWTSAADSAVWSSSVAHGGTYRVVAEYACVAGQEGSRVRFAIGESALELVVPSTGGWGKFRRADLGTVHLDAAGPITLTVQPVAIKSSSALNLRAVRLIPQTP